MVYRGMVDFAGNRIGLSLKEHLAPVADALAADEELYKQFNDYLYARQAVYWWKQKHDPGVDRQDAEQTVALYEQLHPEWMPVADGVTQWFSQLLDYLMMAGGISPEGAAVLRERYPHYVPLWTAEMMDGVFKRAAGKTRFANLPSVIAPAKGSRRRRLPIMEAATLYANRVVSAADSIRVGRAYVKAVEYHGRGPQFAVRVDPAKRPVSFTIKGMKKALEEAGADLSDADLDAVLTIWETMARPSSKDNVVTFWDAGQVQQYWVPPEIHEIVTGLNNRYTLGYLLDIALGAPARIKRLFTTGIRASFGLVWNPVRDIGTRLAQTETKGIASALKIATGYDTIIGMLDYAWQSEVAQLWEGGGGPMSAPLSIDRNFTQEMLRHILDRGPKAKVMAWLRHPVDSLREFYSMPEYGPRIKEFEAAIRAAGWRPGQRLSIYQYLRGQIAAANVTVDFRDGGTYAMFLNRYCAFFNAQIQGPYHFLRVHKRNPVQAAFRGLLYNTLPSLLLWNLNKDKEWYKNLTPLERNLCMHIELAPGCIMRIPRAFEWGFVYGALPEAVCNAMQESSSQPAREWAGQFIQQLHPNWIPNTWHVWLETTFGYSTWQERYIESADERRRLLPADRVHWYTTDTARSIGRLLNVSPKLVEHFAISATSEMSVDAARQIEAIVERLLGETGKPRRPKEAADLAVIGRLFLRSGHTRVYNDFYQRLHLLEQQLGSARLNKTPFANSAEYARMKSALGTLATRREQRHAWLLRENLSNDTKLELIRGSVHDDERTIKEVMRR